MTKLSYQHLANACASGGATAMSIMTSLTPAGGDHVAIRPSNYRAYSRGYETRMIENHPTKTLIIDSPEEQQYRVEQAFRQTIYDGHPLFSRIPHLLIESETGRVTYADFEFPQRIYDLRVSQGLIDNIPVVDHPLYQQLCQTHPDNARILLQTSPTTLILGTSELSESDTRWRYHSIFSGEIIGLPAWLKESNTSSTEETTSEPHHPHTSNSAINIRFNPAPLSHNADSDEMEGLLGIGDVLEGESCSFHQILRTQLISFSGLRTLRFDCGIAGDIACRALLAAYTLAGVCRANHELHLRAQCDLIQTGNSTIRLMKTENDYYTVDEPSIDDCDEILEQALVEAFKEADINWNGQTIHIISEE